jgi:O-antigen/teichoic acid export membrane protein
MNFLPNFSTLKKHPSIRKYFSNTSWLLGERILRMGVSLFVGIYIVRYLGPEKYGLLSYTMSFVWIFSALLDLGHREIIVRELVLYPEQRNVILGSAILLRLSGAVFLVSGVAIGLQLVDNDEQTSLMIVIIALGMAFQSWELIDYYFQSQVQSKYTAWAQTVQLIVASLIKIYLIIWQAPLIYFAAIFSLEYVITAALFLLMYKWQVGSFPIRNCNLKYAKQMLKNSFPLLLTGTAILIYMKIDQVMLKELVGTETVGTYAAAVKLCEVWYHIPVLIAVSLYPAIIGVKDKDPALYHAQLQKLYTLLVWVALVLAIPITFLADWIIYILYGNEYIESVIILKIYVWAGIFVSMSLANNKWMVIENFQNYILLTTLLGMSSNIIFNVILIPSYGAPGAAVATLISYGIGSYLSLFLFAKVRKGFWFATKSINPYSVFTFSYNSK